MHLKSPYPDVPPIPDTNVHNIYFAASSQWPNFTLYIDGVTGRKRTYSEFVARINDTMTGFASSVTAGGLGISSHEGVMIGIVSENIMDYPVLVHSLLAMTLPFVLISASYTPFEFTHALGLSKPTHLFVHPRLLPVVLPVAKKAGVSSRNIFVLGGRASGYRSLSEVVDGVRRSKLPRQPVREAKKDTLAYLAFSSGTSGLPKAVMISHGNLISIHFQLGIITKAIVETFQEPPTLPTEEGLPCSLAYLPMHHSYGLHAYCFSFLVPQTYIIIPRWNIEFALKLIVKYKITSLTLIPSVFHQLLNYPGIDKADLSSIRTVNNGAAYLPLELMNKMSRLVPQGTMMTEGYGMTEGTLASILRPYPGVLGGRLTYIPGSAGVLIPGLEGRLVRDDGSDIDAADEVGELYIKGNNVALGYWRNEKATKETFINGWLRTGDKFRVDKDGYFFFMDRAKDTLKVSGMQVSPVEIENVLLNHPDKLITDATVAGVSGGRTSDEKVPRAWVVLSPDGKKLGRAAVIKELQLWHQESLSKYKWLRGGIEVVKEIPKSPTGKTLRRVLVEQYEQQVKSRL